MDTDLVREIAYLLYAHDAGQDKTALGNWYEAEALYRHAVEHHAACVTIPCVELVKVYLPE